MLDGSDGKMAAAIVQMSCLYRGMLAVRATGIRPLIPGLVPAQFRAFSLRKEPVLEQNPYYNKYQDKIQKLRSAKPQEFKARVEKSHEAKKEVLGHSKQAEFIRLMEQELEKKDKMAAGEGAAGGFTKNKMLGENAPSQLILYHYPDLKDEKGVVLMTAELDPKFIREETYRLVETFNHHPADFKHMLVIAELEQSGLGSAVHPGG
ncbi:hypothetical protein FQN60_012712, partial [Etheostoma spectabile]